MGLLPLLADVLAFLNKILLLVALLCKSDIIKAELTIF